MISLAGNILRIQPPLNIDRSEIIKGFEIIDSAIADYREGNISDEVLVNRAGW